MELKIKKLKESAKLPTYGSEFAAGADLYAAEEENIIINPHETKLIHTGFAMEIPVGYVGLIYARSGLASKRHLAPANKVGVVDADYRGEVKVSLHNHSGNVQTVSPNERIAQIVFTPYLKVDFKECEELSETSRGSGGFGSTN